MSKTNQCAQSMSKEILVLDAGRNLRRIPWPHVQLRMNDAEAVQQAVEHTSCSVEERCNFRKTDAETRTKPG